MDAPRKTISSSPSIAALAFMLALLGAGSMAYYHLGLFVPRALQVRASNGLAGSHSFGNDFYQIWLSSQDWLSQHRDPYSEEETQHIQVGLYGRLLDPHRPGDPKDRRGFPYPAFAEILFWPTTQFPFPAVRLAVLLSLIGLTAAAVLVWMRALGWNPGRLWSATIVVLVLCSYPILEGLYAGQVGLLVGFLLAASVLALQRGKFLLSGVLIALTTIKPQVSILAILYLLVWSVCDWRRRWAFCAGFFATTALLVGGALLIWPHWISTWIHVLLQYHGYTPPPLLGDILRNLFGYVAGPVYVIATTVLMAGGLVLLWQTRNVPRHSTEFWFTLSLLLALTTIAILPGQAVYDHGILLPGVFLVSSRWRTLTANWVLRATLIVGAAVLTWPWIASLAVLMLRPLLSDKQFYSKPIFALPLHTAAVFPFVVLGLLALARRVATTSSNPVASLAG